MPVGPRLVLLVGLLPILLLGCLSPAFGEAAGDAAPQPPPPASPHKHVLVINSYHLGYPWSDGILRGLQEIVGPAPAVEVYTEFLDTKRVNDAAHLANLAALFRHKFSNVTFDVVVAVDSDALDFVRANRTNLFPQVPVVFCGVHDYQDALLEGQGPMTGVVETIDYLGCVELALELRPTARRVVVVTDRTRTGVDFERGVRAVLPSLKGRAEFEFLSLTDMTLPEMKDRLRGLKDDSVVLVLAHFLDRTGRLYS